MDSLPKVRQIYFDNVSKFQEISELYKRMRDKNFGGRFCVGGHCKTIFMVEIRFDGDSNWGASPKTFYNKEEAEKEVEALKLKYPFLSEYKIVTRKINEKKKKD